VLAAAALVEDVPDEPVEPSLDEVEAVFSDDFSEDEPVDPQPSELDESEDDLLEERLSVL